MWILAFPIRSCGSLEPRVPASEIVVNLKPVRVSRRVREIKKRLMVVGFRG
jgi:hypothetical protein